MSDLESDDDTDRTPNWELLASTLGNETLELLKSHLNKDKAIVEEKVPIRIVDPLSKLEKPNSVFKLQSYWEERFKEEENFEWLTTWVQVREFILPHLKKTDKILIVGCGNSTFSADIYKEGFENIFNIDFAESVILRMQEQYKESCPNMRWEVMDMTNMTYPNETFDVVLDKAAMDALVVDEGDVWDPADSVIQSVDKMCLSVNRVLKRDNGKFLQISFAQPHFRTKYLIGYRAENKSCNAYESHKGFAERYQWDLDFQKLQLSEGCLESFLFVMSRKH